MLNRIPETFPIATAMPLSFEVQTTAEPADDFTALVIQALEDIHKAKKLADELGDNTYIYGKEADFFDSEVADAIHSQKKKMFSSAVRTHTNLAQTLMNMQI